jgi:uncharacterized protein
LPKLSRITIYPVKSLDGLSVNRARILPSGALEHDRQYAIIDSEGWFVMGKRTPQVHAIRSTFDLEANAVTAWKEGTDVSRRFHLDRDRASLNSYLSDALGLDVSLHENPEAGFPDDIEAPGPTVLGSGTVEAVAGWFGLEPDDIRARFRANLEIGGVEPFWEDRLFAGRGSVVRFRVGDVVFEGTNPCQRCVVPSRSQITGDAISGFQKTFAERRKASLPAWADISRFDHFYRLAVNTRLAASGPGIIRLGDTIEILGTE